MVTIEELVQQLVEREGPDLPIPAAALLYEASQAAQQKRYEDALRLTELARKLSPSEPAAHFLRAGVIFRENRLHVLSSLEAWLDGWAARTRARGENRSRNHLRKAQTEGMFGSCLKELWLTELRRWLGCDRPRVSYAEQLNEHDESNCCTGIDRSHTLGSGWVVDS